MDNDELARVLKRLERLIDDFGHVTENISRAIKENPREAALLAGAVYLTYTALKSENEPDVDIYVWDVEHGDCFLIKGPEENLVVDLSQHRNGFSPSRNMAQYIDEVGTLIISHPDRDHIEDILNFYDEFDPGTFVRPKAATKYLKHKKENVYPNDETYQQITAKYLEITEERYTVTPTQGISSEQRNQGLTVDTHSLSEYQISPPKLLSEYDDGQSPDINNLSLLNIIEYNDFKLVTGGDLKKKAIENLLEDSEVQKDLYGTDVLIAPHHGRRSSYCGKLFDIITPDLVIVSDKSDVDSSKTATDSYSRQAGGKWVESAGGNLESKTRYCMSTRDVGYINLEVDSAGGYNVYIR